MYLLVVGEWLYFRGVVCAGGGDHRHATKTLGPILLVGLVRDEGPPPKSVITNTQTELRIQCDSIILSNRPTLSCFNSDVQIVNVL